MLQSELAASLCGAIVGPSGAVEGWVGVELIVDRQGTRNETSSRARKAGPAGASDTVAYARVILEITVGYGDGTGMSGRGCKEGEC